MESPIIPENIIGKESDLEHSVTLSTRDEALHCFKRAFKRLLNPAVWHELCGTFSASFMLNGETGDKVTRLAQAGDYFQIDIPGPGNSAGDGYDWVHVDTVQDDSAPDGEEEGFGMMVRSCPNPKKQDKGTAHFFKDTATSTFIIHRKGNVVSASYHGRNEVPNTDTSKASDNIRNAVIATGAFAFLSEAQWSALIRSFLEKEIGGS